MPDLRLRRLDRVALVDVGANQGAHVMLWKRLDPATVKAGDGQPGPMQVCEDCGKKMVNGAKECPHCGATYTAEKRIAPELDLYKKSYSRERRVELAKAGKAIPVKNGEGEIVDGRYPIEDADDLGNAVKAFGRGDPGDKAEIKSYIVRRAKALKRTDLLPEDWPGSTKAKKVGRKISATRLAALRAAHDALAHVIAEAVEAPATKPTVGDPKKGGNMPDAFDKSKLDDDARAYVEGLEQKLAEAKKDPEPKPEDPLAKALESDDPIVKSLAEQLSATTKRAESAETRVDQEIEKREIGEWVGKAATLKHLAVKADEFGPELRKLSKHDSPLADKVMEVLSAANAQVETAELFTELGKGFGGDESTASGQIEKLAQERVSKGESPTIEQARVDVVNDQANAELVDRERAEREEAKR